MKSNLIYLVLKKPLVLGIGAIAIISVSLTLSILHADSRELHKEQVQYFVTTKQWSHYYDLSRMFDDVTYAYALTTHKAQGSTINYVFLDIKDMRGYSDRQKLLYTALTRARTQVLIPN